MYTEAIVTCYFEPTFAAVGTVCSTSKTSIRSKTKALSSLQSPIASQFLASVANSSAIAMPHEAQITSETTTVKASNPQAASGKRKGRPGDL